jgi:hypothetical protein
MIVPQLKNNIGAGLAARATQAWDLFARAGVEEQRAIDALDEEFS